MSLPRISKTPQAPPVAAKTKKVNRLNVEQARKESQMTEERLGEQFRYFFREYMEAATSAQVTVPLDLIEDKPGFLFSFVKNAGPKHLFEVLRTNLENVHVLRCALSLQIITITILRRKLPEQIGGINNPHNVGHLQTVVPDAITSWTLDALAKTCDASAVSICISVLIGSSNPSVQELALSLLTSILAVSDNAIMQMLKVPNTLNSNPDSFKSSRNNSAASNVTLEELNALQIDTNKNPKDSVDFSKFNFKYNPTDYSKKRDRPKKTPRSDNHTCLSYVLSVAMVQKNRHLLTAGCADIILVMTRVNTSAMCEAIAQTPTCPLPLVTENLKNNGGIGGGGSGGGSGGGGGVSSGAAAGIGSGGGAAAGGAGAGAGSGKPYSLSSGPNAGSKAVSINPLTSNIVEWAGLKIMLKFLFRYQQITNQSRSDSIMRDSVSASLRLREELLYAHSKVFSAVCALVGGSSVVAEYTNRLPGAEQLLKLAAVVHANTSTEPSVDDEQNVQGCLDALAQDRAAKQALQDLENEHKRQQALLAGLDANGRKSRGGTVGSPNRKYRGEGAAAAGATNGPPMKTIGSNIRHDVHNAKVQLSQNITVDFRGQYDVEQEKGKLYIINTVDGTYKNTASEAIQKQLKGIENKKNTTTGLTYDPHSDKLLDSSLEAIDYTTKKITVDTSNEDEVMPPHSAISPHLLPPRPDTKHHHHHHGHNPMYEQLDKLDDTAPQHYGSNSSHGSKSSASFLYQKQAANVSLTGGITVVDTEQLLKNHKFNAKTDFFDALPSKPVIPTRIEPKSVINPDEDLMEIQQKFQQMADKAVKKIQSGVGYMRNGKNSIPIEEKARRVYSPTKGGVEAMLASMGFTSSRASGGGGGGGSSRPATGSVRSGAGSPKPGSSSSGGGGGRSVGGAKEDLNGTGRFSSFRDEAGNPSVSRRTYSPDFVSTDVDETDEQGGGGDLNPANAKTIAWNRNSYQPNDSFNSVPSSPPIYGLKLESMDFEGQDLFDNFTPLFELPVRPMTTSEKLRENSADSPVKKNPGKLKVDMIQSMDIITQ